MFCLLNSHFGMTLVQPLEREKVGFSSKFKSDAGFGSALEMVLDHLQR